MKNFTAVGVMATLLAMVIVAAGCTTTTTNQTSTFTPSTTAATSAASRDAFLEKYVNQLYNNVQKDYRYTLKAWDVNWLNSTTVHVVLTFENKTSQEVVNENMTIMHFKSTDDATAYFNSLNKTGFTLYRNIYKGGVYQDVTGHAPVPYKQYLKEIIAYKQSSWQELLGDIVRIEETTRL
jgi:hypothetical protein